MATTEFSKFAGKLSAALLQHHLLGFEIAQVEATNYTVLFTVSIRSKCHLLLGFLNILKGWLESKSSYQVPQTV